jgi:hypothetical protein
VYLKQHTYMPTYININPYTHTSFPTFIILCFRQEKKASLLVKFAKYKGGTEGATYKDNKVAVWDAQTGRMDCVATLFQKSGAAYQSKVIKLCAMTMPERSAVAEFEVDVAVLVAAGGPGISSTHSVNTKAKKCFDKSAALTASVTVTRLADDDANSELESNYDPSDQNDLDDLDVSHYGSAGGEPSPTSSQRGSFTSEVDAEDAENRGPFESFDGEGKTGVEERTKELVAENEGLESKIRALQDKVGLMEAEKVEMAEALTLAEQKSSHAQALSEHAETQRKDLAEAMQGVEKKLQTQRRNSVEIVQGLENDAAGFQEQVAKLQTDLQRAKAEHAEREQQWSRKLEATLKDQTRFVKMKLDKTQTEQDLVKKQAQIVGLEQAAMEHHTYVAKLDAKLLALQGALHDKTLQEVELMGRVHSLEVELDHAKKHVDQTLSLEGAAREDTISALQAQLREAEGQTNVVAFEEQLDSIAQANDLLEQMNMALKAELNEKDLEMDDLLHEHTRLKLQFEEGREATRNTEAPYAEISPALISSSATTSTTSSTSPTSAASTVNKNPKESKFGATLSSKMGSTFKNKERFFTKSKTLGGSMGNLGSTMGNLGSIGKSGQMGKLSKLSQLTTQGPYRDALVSMVVRPPRSNYAPEELGPTELEFAMQSPKFLSAEVSIDVDDSGFKEQTTQSFTRTDLELTNLAGKVLQCSHWEPRDRASMSASAATGSAAAATDRQNNLPCVIYLHSMEGSRLEVMTLLRPLLARGITVFSFDFAGSGISEGSYVTYGMQEQQDLDIVIRHLVSTGAGPLNAGVSKFILWGRGMGASTALLYAGGCNASSRQSFRETHLAGLVLDRYHHML